MKPGLSKELDGMARCARELELMSVFVLEGASPADESLWQRTP